MSLVCETIVSEDELSQTQSHHNCDDEELDYEEEDNNDKNDEIKSDEQNKCAKYSEAQDDDKDEGELDDDDDLEEGEVKEDDDECDGSAGVNANRKRVMAPDITDNRVNNNNNNSSNNNNAVTNVCRFFGRGQCTWGNSCRFMHPTGGMMKRMLPLPPPMPPMPPLPPHMPPHQQNRGRPQREFFDSSTPAVHATHAASNQTSGGESAWERGLKQAKEMIVRASRRKEEEIDFEDKRFNLGVEDEASRHSRASRESSASPFGDRIDNDEYERRRRLAFESAPWNNEEPVGGKQRSAETYRDPWRRSKSPPNTKFRRPFGGSRTGSKRSHSMSSISASGSDSSDFSGSEGSSFSESSASNLSARSASGRRRFNRKTTEKKVEPTNETRFSKKGIQNPNWNKTNSTEPNRDYDSWSDESLSDSDSISSYYSGSNSDSEISNDSDVKSKQRIPKRPVSGARKDEPKAVLPQKRNISETDGPPLKKNKISSNMRSITPNTPLSPLLPQTKSSKAELSTQTVSEKSEATKKSPIKMTFMKKYSKITNKDNLLATKLNGGRDKEEEVLEEEDEDNSILNSPSSLKDVAPQSICSSSPVSQDALTPPQPPQHTSSLSSSPGGGSSKHAIDKQSLSATVSRREELLQQLRAVEDAIARKRNPLN